MIISDKHFHKSDHRFNEHARFKIFDRLTYWQTQILTKKSEENVWFKQKTFGYKNKGLNQKLNMKIYTYDKYAALSAFETNYCLKQSRWGKFENDTIKFKNTFDVTQIWRIYNLKDSLEKIHSNNALGKLVFLLALDPQFINLYTYIQYT